MYRCEICNREFKNGAGLAGHNQLKHGSGQWPSSASERSSERSESGQEALLEQILEQQELLLDGLPEGHVHGSECSACHKLAHQSYEQGIYEALGTVGVTEAVRYHQQAVRWNREHPNHLMVENWSELPGVQEILDSSEPRLIRIVR